MERDTLIQEMRKLHKEVDFAEYLQNIIGGIWVGGSILLFLIHFFFPHFLPTPWFEGFEIGYGTIMCLFLFCNWLRKVELNWKYGEVYTKYCQTYDEYPDKE